MILRDIRVGMRTPRIAVRMDASQHMGALYPFSLADKLKLITEPSAWYAAGRRHGLAVARAVIPFEMVSVLLNYSNDRKHFSGARPGGRACSPTRRSAWSRAAVRRRALRDRSRSGRAERQPAHREHVDPHARIPRGSDEVLATMLLNSASLKDSYANYAADLAACPLSVSAVPSSAPRLRRRAARRGGIRSPLQPDRQARRLRLILDRPLLLERLQRLALHGRVPVRQHQRRWRTDARANQSEIGGGVEQARIPALPARQQRLHLLAQAQACEGFGQAASWPICFTRIAVAAAVRHSRY